MELHVFILDSYLKKKKKQNHHREETQYVFFMSFVGKLVKV